MKKTDTRQWQYIEPLIKSEYNLIVKSDHDYYEYELRSARVQSIKVNKKGVMEITLKTAKSADDSL